MGLKKINIKLSLSFFSMMERTISLHITILLTTLEYSVYKILIMLLLLILILITLIKDEIKITITIMNKIKKLVEKNTPLHRSFVA